MYTCGECGSNFTSQRKLTSHKQQHKTSKLDNTTKIEKKPNEVACKVFGCPYTSTARNLCHHQKTHSRRFRYAEPDEKVETRTCPLCHPNFTITFKNYQRHLTDQHGVEEHAFAKEFPVWFEDEADKERRSWKKLQKERLSEDVLKTKLDELLVVNFEMSKLLRHYEFTRPIVKTQPDATNLKIEKLRCQRRSLRTQLQDYRADKKEAKLHSDALW